jgi:hypothetical protein
MTYASTFDVERKIIYVVVSGSGNTLNDALEFLRNNRLDERYSSDYRTIVDIRNAEFDRSASDSAAVGRVFGYFFPNEKIAYVATGMNIGLADYVKLSAQFKVDMQIFTTVGAAENWLIDSSLH